MAPIARNVGNILAQTKIKEHQDDYSIVFIDPAQRDEVWNALKNLKSFTSYTFTDDEVSLVIRSTEWEKLKKCFGGSKEEGPYRLITFDIVLDLSIVGFLSVVSTALAESGVSVYALSTYLTDHILVKKKDARKAIGVLNEMITKSSIV